MSKIAKILLCALLVAALAVPAFAEQYMCKAHHLLQSHSGHLQRQCYSPGAHRRSSHRLSEKDLQPVQPMP